MHDALKKKGGKKIGHGVASDIISYIHPSRYECRYERDRLEHTSALSSFSFIFNFVFVIGDIPNRRVNVLCWIPAFPSFFFLFFLNFSSSPIVTVKRKSFLKKLAGAESLFVQIKPPSHRRNNITQPRLGERIILYKFGG